MNPVAALGQFELNLSYSSLSDILKRQFLEIFQQAQGSESPALMKEVVCQYSLDTKFLCAPPSYVNTTPIPETLLGQIREKEQDSPLRRIFWKPLQSYLGHIISFGIARAALYPGSTHFFNDIRRQENAVSWGIDSVSHFDSVGTERVPL